MNAQIRQIIAEQGRLPTPAESLADDTDLYRAGLTSFASVQLMLALEEAFDIEFPDSMLNRATFATPGAIEQAVGQLAQQEAA